MEENARLFLPGWNALERNLLGCCVGLLLFAVLIFINWIFISKERKKKEKEQQRVAKLKEKK